MYFCTSRIANHSIAVLAQAENEESLDNAEQPHHLTGGCRTSKGRGNREGHRKKPPCDFGLGISDFGIFDAEWRVRVKMGGKSARRLRVNGLRVNLAG
jgi:hypothetical protein